MACAMDADRHAELREPRPQYALRKEAHSPRVLPAILLELNEAKNEQALPGRLW